MGARRGGALANGNGNGSIASWKMLAGVFRTALQLFVAAVLTLMFAEWREFQKEVRTNIEKLDMANKAQDELSTQIRVVGFERLSKVETLIEETKNRLDRHEDQSRGRPTARSGAP